MKKKIKKTKEKMDAEVMGCMETFIRQLSMRWRVSERIEQANRWADAHRKQTVCLTIGALVLSIALHLLLTLSAPKQRENMVGSIESVQPMFTELQRIQKVKDYHLRQMDGLALRGQHIKEELDSLVHLPIKTHGDSLRIIAKYRQLEMIAKNLKQQ